MRVVKRLFFPDAFVVYPLMNNFGGLGINPTMFAWYQVFGVDPGNTRHLIAPDIVNEKMMETSDGGDNWTEIPNLTSQVTNAGQFLFRRSIFPQASAVSFSPDDPKVVAIGTWQAGLFFSGTKKEMDVTLTETTRFVGFVGARAPVAPERRMLVGLTLSDRGNPLGAAFAEKTLSMYEPTDQEKNQDKEPSGRQNSPTAE